MEVLGRRGRGVLRSSDDQRPTPEIAITTLREVSRYGALHMFLRGRKILASLSQQRGDRVLQVRFRVPSQGERG